MFEDIKKIRIPMALTRMEWMNIEMDSLA